MRIISGTAKGRQLKAPKGRTRPTSDLVRGAIFDMLASMGAPLVGGRVLDLYAGSGALGLEALSRGARWADFVEQDPLAVQTIKQNLEALGFADRGRVYRLTARKALRVVEGPYDIIFMDPPYNLPNLVGAVEEVVRSGRTGPGTVLVVEHPRTVALPDELDGFVRVRQRTYGGTAVSIYTRGEEDAR
jgi:16S rRNA (guanine(966)-N(2))-methyltransferase RsmD